MTRTLSDRDRAFLDRHRALGRQQSDDDVRGSADIVEVAGYIRRESDAAYLFYDGAREAWVPKSQVKPIKEGLAMPEWLAKKKGFI